MLWIPCQPFLPYFKEKLELHCFFFKLSLLVLCISFFPQSKTLNCPFLLSLVVFPFSQSSHHLSPLQRQTVYSKLSYLFSHLLFILQSAPIYFLPPVLTLISPRSQMTFLALNLASILHLLLLCLNSKQDWWVTHAHLLQVIYFPSLLQKVLVLWMFFCLLSRSFYFSNCPLHGPHGQFTLDFPGAMTPWSMPPA